MSTEEVTEKYKGENCDSCAHCDTQQCPIRHLATHDLSICEDFFPSLECRRTRALETLADVMVELAHSSIGLELGD